jgi:hypothetical protein
MQVYTRKPPNLCMLHTGRRAWGTTTSAPDYINLSLGRLGFTSTTLSAATTRHPATHALLQPRRAPRVLVFTLPAAAIYLDYAARPGASARRVARHAARRAARRRLLRLA